MRIVFLVGICAVVTVVILWSTGIIDNHSRKLNLLEQHKKLSGSVDFVGTVWQNGGGKNIIYFSSPDTLVYSSFSPDVYESHNARKLRAVCNYRYDPQYRIFTIPRIGMQYQVSMRVTIDSVKNEIYLDDLENFQRWSQETSGRLEGKIR